MGMGGGAGMGWAQEKRGKERPEQRGRQQAARQTMWQEPREQRGDVGSGKTRTLDMNSLPTTSFIG